MKFSTISGAVMDMDGVLWRGDTPLPGMIELFQWLGENNLPFALATNNSSKTPADYVAKLAQLGVSGISKHNIVTAGTATVAYLKQHYPPATTVHIFGMVGLHQIIQKAGFEITNTNDNTPSVVVAGIDFNLSYENLKLATLAIRAGADFIGTNPDKTFPSPEGLLPGTGSMIAALEAATDKKAIIMGKPGTPMFTAALEITGTPPENTIMIGDRINTDILGGIQAGMKTALLFTGVTSPDDLAQDTDGIWPDVAYESLVDLIKAWAGDDWYHQQVKKNHK
jgi:4-nitrophenyl phosphatase